MPVITDKTRDVIIEVRNLTRKFASFTALDDLSFNIYRGEIFGLLGPNGAGKSTFISVLTTLSRPTSGDIIINNFSVRKEPEKIKKSIGLVPQDIALYPMLSGLDNLKFWAGIYGLKGTLKAERIKDVLSIVRLEDRARDRVDTWSGGMKRRLNIAVALLHQPEILVMDEPTAGVDIYSRKFIFDAIRNLQKKNTTIIFTSHYIDEMEDSCNRIALIQKGKLDAIGTPEELMKANGIEKLEDIMLKYPV
jgi:ABC-2 type transport system ATP-binding protein